MRTDTLMEGNGSIIDLSYLYPEGIPSGLQDGTRKIKVLGKTERIIHTVAVKLEGCILRNVARPLLYNAGYACIDLVDIIDERIGDITHSGPDFTKVFSEDQIRELAIGFPHTKKATYPEIISYYSHIGLSKRQAGKIRSYILSHFPNRNTSSNIPA